MKPTLTNLQNIVWKLKYNYLIMQGTHCRLDSNTMHHVVRTGAMAYAVTEEVRSLCGQGPGIFIIERKANATADPRLHPIDEISEQHHFLGDPLVLAPHDPVERAGKDLLLVFLDLHQEGVDGRQAFGVPALGPGLVRRAVELAVQSQ